jgi:hypothetical protein
MPGADKNKDQTTNRRKTNPLTLALSPGGERGQSQKKVLIPLGGQGTVAKKVLIPLGGQGTVAKKVLIPLGGQGTVARKSFSALGEKVAVRPDEGVTATSRANRNRDYL